MHLKGVSIRQPINPPKLALFGPGLTGTDQSVSPRGDDNHHPLEKLGTREIIKCPIATICLECPLMHEMSLAEGVLQLIEDAARREKFATVTTVWLEIGQLSSVEPEAMKFCFEAVVRGSIAEGAQLEIISTPGIGWCIVCSKTVPLGEIFGACPQCGGHRVQVTGGREMRLKELEVA